MWTGVVAKRSAHASIVWGMHAILDHAREKPAFVGEVLRQFNVPPTMMQTLGPTIVAKLPRSLDDAEMTQILAVFEQLIPIQWDNDMAAVPPDVAAEVRRVIRSTLEASDKTVTPRQFSARLQPELVRLLGPYVAADVLATLPDRCNPTLVSHLWRIHGDPKELANLVDWLVDEIRECGVALGAD